MAAGLQTFKTPFGTPLIFNPNRYAFTYSGLRVRLLNKVLDPIFPFDSAGISEKLGKSRGVSPETIQQEWKLLGDFSLQFRKFVNFALIKEEEEVREGTTKHSHQSIKSIPNAEDIFTATAGSIAAFRRRHRILETDLKVFSPEFRLVAGCDALGIDREDGTLTFCDWRFTSQQASSFAFGSFDEPTPLSIANTKANKSTLHLQLTAFLFERGGYRSMYPDGSSSKQLKFVSVQPTESGCAALPVPVSLSSVPQDLIDEFSSANYMLWLLRDLSSS
jgi:hypothetical protein